MKVFKVALVLLLSASVFGHDRGRYDFSISSRTASRVLAANGASDTLKDGADVVVDNDNDDVQINAAIVAVNADGGGDVWFVGGSFDIESPVTLLSNVRLMMAEGASLLRGSSNPSQMINIGAISNWAIIGGKIDGNGSSSSVKMIRFNSTSLCSDGIIRDVIVNNIGTSAASDAVFQVEGATIQTPVRVTIENCTFDAEVAGAPKCDDGLDINTMGDSVIRNCLIRGFLDNGIDTEAAKNVIIEGNHIINCDGHGIELEMSIEAGSLDVAEGCKVINNTIEDIDQGTADWAIYVNSGAKNIISGNHIINCQNGIGPFEKDAAGTGASVQNHVTGNHLDTIAVDGIKESSGHSADNNFFADNKFISVSGNEYDLDGTSSVIATSSGGILYCGNISDLSADAFMKLPVTGTGLTMSATLGYPMQRAGFVTSMTVSATITTDADCDGNYIVAFDASDKTALNVRYDETDGDTRVENSTRVAPGSAAFAAGEVINVRWDEVTDGITLDDSVVVLEIQYFD